MKEEWKPCKGFEEFYEVSNTGKVRSIALYSAKYKRIIRRKYPKELSAETNREGYKRVVLCLYGVHHHFTVHRLVANAFIPNGNNLPEINHKDENKANNNVTNLEWCSRVYNANYGTNPQRIKERMQNNHPTAIKVNQYSMDGKFIKTWKSQREAARSLGIRGENISRNIKGKYHHAGGYLWKNAN